MVGLREARTSRQLRYWEYFPFLLLNLAMLHAERRTAALACWRLANLLHNINFNLINLHVEYLKHYQTWLLINRIQSHHEYSC